MSQHNVFEPGPDTSSPAAQSKGMHLFSLGVGDNEKHYYMPEQVPPNIAFKFMRDRRREDVVYAVAGLIENAIGPDALDALAEADDMSAEDMRTLMKIIQEKVMGHMEDVMSLGN